MNLRIPGPTPCPPEVLAALCRQMINHRGPEMAALARSVIERLGPFFQTGSRAPYRKRDGRGLKRPWSTRYPRATVCSV